VTDKLAEPTFQFRWDGSYTVVCSCCEERWDPFIDEFGNAECTCCQSEIRPDLEGLKERVHYDD
jgi:hypothetical protein